MISTLYDLIDRYRKELVRMKLSKVQRQVKYEEQQRKLMRELIADDDNNNNYEDIIKMQKLSSDEDEVSEEGND